jgi:hypothetical protein
MTEEESLLEALEIMERTTALLAKDGDLEMIGMTKAYKHAINLCKLKGGLLDD